MTRQKTFPLSSEPAQILQLSVHVFAPLKLTSAVLCLVAHVSDSLKLLGL